MNLSDIQAIIKREIQAVHANPGLNGCEAMAAVRHLEKVSEAARRFEVIKNHNKSLPHSIADGFFENQPKGRANA